MLQRTYSLTAPNNCNNGIENEPGSLPVLSYIQAERHIYGSSRIGLDITEKEMIGAAAPGSTDFERVLGYKQFEGVNHMGNVLVVVTDMKIPRDDNSDLTMDYFQPFVISAQDYSPFGVTLTERAFYSEEYRYGWGSHEKVDEISGAGNHYTAEFWEYDSRTGRRWNIDPVYKHHLSNYSVMSGNPISRIDPNGANDGWIEDETGELTWDENINSQEDFDKSGYDKDKFSYAGQELQRGESLGSTAFFTVYYGKDGTTSLYDYPMWVFNGKQHIGLTEGGNATIQAMIDNMNAAFPRSDGKTPISSDAEPWCGVFVYDCLTSAGQSVTQKPKTWQTPALNTFYSNNWAEGTVLTNPTYGAIAVMSYGHVAMVVGYDDTYVWILGGNQPANGAVVRDGTEVNITRYKRSLVSKYVIPTGYNAPPLGTMYGE